jgi:hypothetical protein
VFFTFLLKAKEREEDYAFAIYKCMFTTHFAPKVHKRKKKEVRQAYINEDKISTTNCPQKSKSKPNPKTQIKTSFGSSFPMKNQNKQFF